MKIIKFDLDGVLLEEKPTFERALARPIPGMKDLIKRLRQASNTIIIETGRGWAEHKLTVHQLEEAGIEYDLLLMGKATCDYVIDDRVIEFKGNAREIELRLFNNNDFDAYSIYQVRKATYEFLLSLRLQGNVLELGAMKRDEMPFPAKTP